MKNKCSGRKVGKKAKCHIATHLYTTKFDSNAYTPPVLFKEGTPPCITKYGNQH